MTTQISSTLAELGRANSTITAETLWLDLGPGSTVPVPDASEVQGLSGGSVMRRVASGRRTGYGGFMGGLFWA
jgi:hypothetical protein